MALRSTQPLTEMNTMDVSWGVKAAGVCGSQPYYLHVPTVLKSGSLGLLEPSGPVQACNGIALTFCKSFCLYCYRHATRMCRILLSSVSCLAIPHFSTLSHKRCDFRGGGVIEPNCVINILYNICLKYIPF
jgi:hypothetical protein